MATHLPGDRGGRPTAVTSMTRYADEQQQQVPKDTAASRRLLPLAVWSQGKEVRYETTQREDIEWGVPVKKEVKVEKLTPDPPLTPSSHIFAAGVIAMAVGAGFVGIALPKPQPDEDLPDDENEQD